MFFFKFNDTFVLEEKSLLIIGKFESFHLGHLNLLKEAVVSASKKDLKIILMIYPNEHNSLFSWEEREIILSKIGIDLIMIFEPSFKNYQLSISDFVKIIKNKYNTQIVFSGDDFTFNKTDDDFSILNKLIEVELFKRIRYDNQIISTFLIKNALISGEIELVNELLGFNYFYYGRVIPGNQKGTEINFPTANVKFDEFKIQPKEGIYFSYLVFDQKKYPSLTSISNNPTHENLNYLKFETYVLNFKDNLYGKYVKIELLKYLRQPQKFPNDKELILKIKDDVSRAIIYFNNIKK